MYGCAKVLIGGRCGHAGRLDSDVDVIGECVIVDVIDKMFCDRMLQTKNGEILEQSRVALPKILFTLSWRRISKV